MIYSRLTTVAAVAALLMSSACAQPVATPAALDTRNDTCTHCRMTVSDQRFAAQIVAPGEEPRFFDDVGCLRAYLEGGAQLAPGSAVFTASFRTREWAPAAQAVYSKNDAIETPMGSHYVAFGSADERAAESESRPGGSSLSAADVFGSHLNGAVTR